MAAAEVEEVEWFLDRINRIYRIEIGEVEEPFDIGDEDGWAAGAEIGADPVCFGFACRDKSLCAAEADTLNWTDQSFLPTMIGASDWVVAALRNPMDVLPPERGPPEARHPRAMYPDLISGTKLIDACPCAG